jgi:uncharacterized protein YndB with AHSA1/START domain
MVPKAHESAEQSVQKEFVITRTLDAPRELVWKAWSEPERMKQWWGPKGSAVEEIRMDFRPGGTCLYRFRFAGQEMWGKFVYREIAAPERIVWVNSFSNANSEVTRHPLSPAWPAEMLSTLTLTEEQGKTTVTIRWIPISPTDEERRTFEHGHASMQQGWTGTLDRLAAYLAKHA